MDCLLLAPDRSGTGYSFRSNSLFVSLSARLRENGWTDLHEIFREGEGGLTMGRPDYTFGQFRETARSAKRGRGLLCFTPALVFCLVSVSECRHIFKKSSNSRRIHGHT